MAGKLDQHRPGGTPTHRQPSPEQHIRPACPWGLRSFGPFSRAPATAPLTHRVCACDRQLRARIGHFQEGEFLTLGRFWRFGRSDPHWHAPLAANETLIYKALFSNQGRSAARSAYEAVRSPFGNFCRRRRCPLVHVGAGQVAEAQPCKAWFGKRP